MTDNWKDLKQWREKESGRIDECRQDIDQLLGSMQDVKRDVVMQERNLREIDGSHRKANEELHRMLKKQTQFRERTDERVDACEKDVDEIRQRLRTITLKIEETPRPAIINQHVRREVGFRPIEREASPVRELDNESPVLFSPRAIRGQKEFLQPAPSMG
jgi:chromosome segregation ATPase